MSAPVNPPRGFLYEIRCPDDQVRGHLLGTASFADAEMLRLNEEILRCFEEASHLVIPMKSSLMKNVKKIARPSVLPLTTRMTRIVLALGFNLVTDMGLPDLAKKRKIKVLDLESQKQQNGALEALARNLPESFEEHRDGVREMSAAWKEGNHQHLESTLAEMRKVYPKEDFAAIMTLRNALFAEKIHGLLEGKKTAQPFVAIDAMQLYGETGVIELLGQRSWTLVRL